MPYQFSIWLDDKTAKDLDILSLLEERKRGSMIKVLIRRAVKNLPQADVTLINPSIQNKAKKNKQEGLNVSG